MEEIRAIIKVIKTTNLSREELIVFATSLIGDSTIAAKIINTLFKNLAN